MAAERWVRTCLGSVPDRAERARRFCTSVLAKDWERGIVGWEGKVGQEEGYLWIL